MTADTIAKRHARRLLELETLGVVTRTAEGKWAVDERVLEKLDAMDKTHPRTRLVVERQALGLGEQIAHHPGPVWLDHVGLDGLAPFGFGAELKDAVAKRRQALRERGIDPGGQERDRSLRNLEQGELAGRIADATGAEQIRRIPPGFRGTVRLHDAADRAAYAEVHDGKRFVLLPASRSLRARVGQTVVFSYDAEGRLTIRRADRDRGLS